jgi:hypothetical protein
MKKETLSGIMLSFMGRIKMKKETLWYHAFIYGENQNEKRNLVVSCFHLWGESK